MKVGDRQLLRGEKIYVRDPHRFIRNEDPPGKGNVNYEINEMIMRPEHFENLKKPSLDEPIVHEEVKNVFVEEVKEKLNLDESNQQQAKQTSNPLNPLKTFLSTFFAPEKHFPIT